MTDAKPNGRSMFDYQVEFHAKWQALKSRINQASVLPFITDTSGMSVRHPNLLLVDFTRLNILGNMPIDHRPMKFMIQWINDQWLFTLMEQAHGATLFTRVIHSDDFATTAAWLVQKAIEVKKCAKDIGLLRKWPTMMR